MTDILDTSTPLGRPLRRKEDARLLHGQTNWTDNIQLPGTLHMAILRSPMAHANIKNIDVSAALTRPHVVAAYSAKELGDLNGSLPCVWPVTDDIQMPGFPALAVDKVRHVGDCVAVVLATDRSAAVDALDAIDVDYEPLPAVVDMEAALAAGSPLVHDGEAASNKCYTFPLPCGDYEGAKAKADVVLKRRFVNQRIMAAFMEPRAVVASPMGMSNEMTVWSSTQIPHVLRVLMALVTGMPENSLRIIAPDVGGGFGGKLQIYREEVLAVQIARHLGRPVKWNETRSEDMVATHHGRDQIQDIEICATKEGKLLGLKVEILANMGAYLQIITPGTPLLGMFMFPGIYKMDAYDFVCHGVFTNTTPTDAIRGAGRPEATFAIERIMDELAAELDIEPMKPAGFSSCAAGVAEAASAAAVAASFASSSAALSLSRFGMAAGAMMSSGRRSRVGSMMLTRMFCEDRTRPLCSCSLRRMKLAIWLRPNRRVACTCASLRATTLGSFDGSGRAATVRVTTPIGETPKALVSV